MRLLRPHPDRDGSCPCIGSSPRPRSTRAQQHRDLVLTIQNTFVSRHACLPRAGGSRVVAPWGASSSLARIRRSFCRRLSRDSSQNTRDPDLAGPRKSKNVVACSSCPVSSSITLFRLSTLPQMSQHSPAEMDKPENSFNDDVDEKAVGQPNPDDILETRKSGTSCWSYCVRAHATGPLQALRISHDGRRSRRSRRRSCSAAWL